MPTTAYLPRLSSRRRDRRRAETGDRISSAIPGIRLAGSGEFMGGVLMATARVGMSMTRFSLRRPEAEELVAEVPAMGGGSAAAAGGAGPALATWSWVPQKRTLVGKTGNSSDAAAGSSRGRATRSASMTGARQSGQVS